jgi:hypothetical protein
MNTWSQARVLKAAISKTRLHLLRTCDTQTDCTVSPDVLRHVTVHKDCWRIKHFQEKDKTINFLLTQKYLSLL